MVDSEWWAAVGTAMVDGGERWTAMADGGERWTVVRDMNGGLWRLDGW